MMAVSAPKTELRVIEAALFDPAASMCCSYPQHYGGGPAGKPAPSRLMRDCAALSAGPRGVETAA